jgi:seryl-tRNA synthetase
MISLKYIRENLDFVKNSLIKKKSDIDIDELMTLDEKRREYLQTVEELRASKNKTSNQISNMMKVRKDAESEIALMQNITNEIKGIEKKLKLIETSINEKIYYIPNIVHDTVPDGENENDNVVVKHWGNKPELNFEILDHVSLGEKLKLFDFKRAVKMSGASFPLYTGFGAKLERALINFMLDFHVEKHGYIELMPPFLSNRQAMQNTGQLPKFEDDMYSIPEDGLFCIPTAEVPVTNFHQGEIIHESDFPFKYTAHTACFRREAGSYGKETKGLSRVHQFNKVELVKFVHPDNSYEELESLLLEAESILKALNLHYRVIELCSGDLSFSAAKCYDIEVWSPADEKYLEVSSCSNFENFQSQRSNIRFRNKKTKKNEFVHTLNGSGVATPRLMIALLETYQQEDGSVCIPEVLHPYFKMDSILIS